MWNDINHLWKINDVSCYNEFQKESYCIMAWTPYFWWKIHLMVSVNDEAKQQGTKKSLQKNKNLFYSSTFETVQHHWLISVSDGVQCCCQTIFTSGLLLCAALAACPQVNLCAVYSSLINSRITMRVQIPLF